MRISRIANRALLYLLKTTSLLAQAQSGSGCTGTAGSSNTPFMSPPGQFSVSPSGAANHRIPSQVPPGVAGMAYNLGLVCSSQGGNGILGLGCRISDLSIISRCARTKAQNGVVGGSVNFEANDRFFLDGPRLVLVSGTYGAAGSEYRTEIESFSQITALDIADSGPASFLVKTKGGLTIEFGNTTNSRIEAVKASGVTAAWTSETVRACAQYKVSDVKVAYSKYSSKGSCLPSLMDYPGNAGSTPVLSRGISVVFVPGASPRLNTVTGYQVSASNLKPKRNGKIQTYLGAALVKECWLTYAAQCNTLYRNQLSSITDCDATGSCFAATSVQWGAKDTDAFATYSTWLNGQFGTTEGWANSAVYPLKMVDVDGLPCIMGFGSNWVKFSLNNGASFKAAINWNPYFGINVGGWSHNSTYLYLFAYANGDAAFCVLGCSSSAVQSALTDHMVFTTVNTNSFFPAMGLFRNFGTESFAMASALNGIEVQRLIGRVCPHCMGCKSSQGTGYRGRIMVAEVLVLTDALSDLMQLQATLTELKAATCQKGDPSLLQQAVSKIASGHTTLEGTQRAIGLV